MSTTVENKTVQAAKKLIELGHKFGDTDLIEQGVEILEELEKETPEIPSTKTYTLKSEDDGTKATNKLEYMCGECKDYYWLDKERKSCPKCRKRKTWKKVEPPKTKTKSFDISQFNIKTNNHQVQTWIDDEGKEHKYTRQEPIKITENKFKDTGEYKEDTEFQKKIKYTPTPRRPPAKQVTVQCINCNRKENVNPVFYREEYRCERCIKKLVGN